jgi:acetylornithine/N-succinyldiaminopimelate aminotransferase
VSCVGHSPQVVVEALAKQAAKLITCSLAFYNEPMIGLAALMAQHSGLYQTFFANSGADANEGAIKLARKWGQICGGRGETAPLSFDIRPANEALAL